MGLSVRSCLPRCRSIQLSVIKMKTMKTSLLLACVVAAIHASPDMKSPDMPVMNEMMARYEKNEPNYHHKQEYKKDEYDNKYDHNDYGYEKDDYKKDSYKKDSYGYDTGYKKDHYGHDSYGPKKQ